MKEPLISTPSDDNSDDARAERLGGFLRKKREEAGLTQQQLATAIGKSQDAVSRLERGEQRLDLVSLAKIGEALSLPPWEFAFDAFMECGSPASKQSQVTEMVRKLVSTLSSPT